MLRDDGRDRNKKKMKKVGRKCDLAATAAVAAAAVADDSVMVHMEEVLCTSRNLRASFPTDSYFSSKEDSKVTAPR